LNRGGHYSSCIQSLEKELRVTDSNNIYNNVFTALPPDLSPNPTMDKAMEAAYLENCDESFAKMLYMIMTQGVSVDYQVRTSFLSFYSTGF